MTTRDARTTARLMLETLPMLMQSFSAELRAMDHPVPMPHFRVLKVLQHGTLTTSELAHRCKVSLPTMSNTVTVLANNGWVERTADPSDRRKADLEITDAGRDLLKRMEGHLVDLLAIRFQGLSQAELDTLHRGVEVLRGLAVPAEESGEAGPE